MEELTAVLNQFGVTALWGIVIYKLLDYAGIAGIFILIRYGFKKAWPTIKEFLDQYET